MTQGILVLIAALGGAFIGAIVSGGLLILSHHLQAKRDDRRQQRAFERAARSESLERIKHFVDMGLRMISLLNKQSEDLKSAAAMIPEFNLALNGALLSARAMGAEQLIDELNEHSNLMINIGGTIGGDTFDRSLLSEPSLLLARIENRYIELKIES